MAKVKPRNYYLAVVYSRHHPYRTAKGNMDLEKKRILVVASTLKEARNKAQDHYGKVLSCKRWKGLSRPDVSNVI